MLYVFLIAIHRPLSIPYACSDITRADLNFLLKLISAGSPVVSGKAFISHTRDGKALSPTVTKGISPCSGRCNDLLGNTSPSSNAWKIGQDCKRVESCMEPGAPTPAHKKRLLCPISPILVTEYLFFFNSWKANKSIVQPCNNSTGNS